MLRFQPLARWLLTAGETLFLNDEEEHATIWAAASHPLDGGVQQAQLLARRRRVTDAALEQAPHARQEAVHPLHAVGAPHLALNA